MTGDGGAGLLVGPGPCPPPDEAGEAGRDDRALGPEDVAARDGAAPGPGGEVFVDGAVALSGGRWVDDVGVAGRLAGSALCVQAATTAVIAMIAAIAVKPFHASWGVAVWRSTV